ncbi:MAG: hypothetical protein OXC19_24765 [Bryobacterales bacterium]|nr:hypothetical protein [Bryobacterales bacterium]
MTAEEFSRQILSRLESPSKSALKTHLRRYGGPKNRDISEVGSLATNPGRQTEFLLGEEPDWSDIQSGRAVQRECDEDLFALVTNRLNESGRKGIVLVTGTAGTGKSTAMMRVCLRLSASGKRVGWIDRYSDLSSHDIQAFLRTNETLDVLAIDDADARGGGSLSFETKNIVDSSTSPLLLLGLRTTQINHCLNPAVMKGIWQKRFVLPDLADSDIDKLLDALEAARRLGELTGKTRREQRRVFRERSSRQLLVAMIEATSGQRFESKVISELTGLAKESASVYALLAVASHFRSGIRLDELLTALGGTSNDLLNEIDSLISNHVVLKRPDGLILTRHRMIATVIFRSLEQSGQLRDVVSGLTFAMATRISPQSRRTSREVKLLQHLVNHDFLLRTIQLDGARQIYSQLEQLLDWSYHYWLQRGSAEVERGELSLADNFLGAARSLKADDLYVNNEYAYLLFRKAIIAPRATESQDLVAQAVSLAGSLIESTRGGSAFPYHVLGSQGLSWSRVGIVDSREKSEFLAMLVKHMESAEKNHPKNAQIAQLATAVKREYLGMAVPVSGKLF